MINPLTVVRKAYHSSRSVLRTRLFRRQIVDDFHALYYDMAPQTWGNTFWLGVRALKNPLDLWCYQEILFETKPDLIVECGTCHGGSAYYLATVCDLLGRGRIVTIDIERRPGLPEHPRIEYVLGSSTDERTVALVKDRAREKGQVMVILDSDHSKDHVLKELRLYSPLVTAGNYLIVEDSNINGHPVSPFDGPGPMEAIDEFMKATKDFVIDDGREKFLVTFNPKGYLKKVQ